jgi:iron complex outermembrane receptor protein
VKAKDTDVNHSLLRRLTLAGVSAAALAAALPALAQETDVEGLIVTAQDYVPQGSVAAGKAGIPLVENPQSITVISRDQIDLLDWSTLGQVVRYTAGVNGENYGPDERVDWLTVRGFNPVQYIDGIQGSIGSITNTGLDLYGAQTVEILKGPASFLYGSAPPGGIVNVTSRRPETAFGGEIGAEIGNNDHWQINGDITGEIAPGFSARLTGLYRDKGTQVRGVGVTRSYIAPAASIDLGDRTRVTVLSFYQDDEVTGDGGGFLPSQGTLLANPLGEIGSDANLGETRYNRFVRTHWGLGYELSHEIGDGWDFEQNVKFTSLDSDQRGIGGAGFVDADFNGVPDDYRTVSRYSFSFAEEVETFGVDNRLTGEIDTGGASHRLLIGVDYRNYDYLGASAFGFGMPNIDVFAPVYGLAIPNLPPVTFSSYEESQTGLYVQDQMRIGEGLIVTLGARYDWVTTKDRLANTEIDEGEASYRAGASYVFANGVTPYVSWARSFQPVAGAGFGGDPFEPTTGEQIEAGVKWDGRGLPDGVKLFATAAAYRITQQNVLTDDPVNLGFQAQVGEVEVQGLEFEIVGRFNERLSLNASYTWSDSEVTEGAAYELGAELPVTPEHKLSALIDWTFQDGPLAGLGASLGARYLSKSAGNLPESYFTTVMINPSVTLFDGSIHYDRDDWRLALTASNLADKEYVARCYSYSNCFYGTRRVVVASLTRRF